MIKGDLIERGFLQSRLGRVHFASSGATEKVLLLLPQSGRSWTMFAGLIPLLSSHYRLVALDYPGSGGSDPLPDGASIYDLAGMVVDVLDGLGVDRASVYGLHIGNKIGAALGSRSSNRVDRLVLAGQSHSLVADAAQRAVTVGKSRRKLLEASDAGEAALVQWSDTFARITALWWNESVMRTLADPETRLRTARRAFDEIQSMQGMTGYYQANYDHDFAADVKLIQVPTLVLEIVTRTEDATIGRQGAALAALMTNAMYAAIEAPDEHGVTLDDRPSELAGLLRGFLSDKAPLIGTDESSCSA